MSRHRRRPRLHGIQAFPAPGHSYIPADDLVAGYTRNLLDCSPFHQEFLGLVIHCAGFSPVFRACKEIFASMLPASASKSLSLVDDPDELAKLLVRFLEGTENVRLEKILRAKLVTIVPKCISESLRKGEYARRIERLRQLFDLSETEICILECFAVYKAHSEFERYCDQYPERDWIALMAVSLGIKATDFRKLVLRGGSLASRGLVEMQGSGIHRNCEIMEYMVGLSEDFLSNDNFSCTGKSKFPLESFPVTENERNIFLDSLCNQTSCHLFLYGRPGTGKTELAKALVSEAGRDAVLVKYGSDGDERDRRGAITATLNVVPVNSVVIVDEADRLLNTATFFQPKDVDKGWINNFMDECRHKVIWIANETGCIETSVLRRFSYSLEFKKFTKDQRASVWNTQLKRHSLRKVIRPPMVARLAQDYEVDAGGIASALKAAENIFTNRTPKAGEVEKTLGQLLEHHEKLSGVDRKKSKLNRLSPHYDVKALHTDLPAENLLQSLKHREKAKLIDGLTLPANIMFWGLPGTGKTELAKYIAQELGKELLVKRMSDLQSMYVGQTEKQIAEAFEEAEKEAAVLFLDEADSLILDRKIASRSWESSQTNEVLTQMENFKGICICCTNLLDNLDEAALRRFTWKIKFLPLTDDGKEKLFHKYFQPRGRLSASVKSALQGIRDLTPGDFKTVHQRQQYSSEGASPLDSVKALKQEVSYKRTRSGDPIGFHSH